MSGPFGSSQWMYASGGFYDFPIEQSLRFNDDDSARLTLTPASAGSRTTWTFSAWVKRGNLGTNQNILREDTGDNLIRFETGNSFRFFTKPADSGCDLITNAIFRDASAWYHIVCVYDTTQATSSERAKVYINGNRITQFSTETYPAQNHNSYINNNVIHGLGGRPTGGEYFDGYLAEVNFIDGQALDASSFGEFKSGVWIPKDPSGLTYGSNGYRLSFADSANIGDDTSGNTNDWTANSLVATDVLLDSPTQNWCVINPLDLPSSTTLSNGNLVFVNNASATWKSAVGTMSASSGKYYAEFTPSSLGLAMIGIVRSGWNADISDSRFWTDADGYAYYSDDGQIYNNGSGSAYGATYTNADVIGVALDLDAGTLTFYKNNVSQGTAATGLSGEYKFVFATQNTNNTITADFGQSGFTYTPPANHLALSTANLPDPVIDPAQDDVPADYFTTALYTGTGSTINLNTIGFQPDLTWIKGRSLAFDHGLFDSVRGGTKQLYSNLTNSEFTWTNGITFDSEGVDISADSNLFNGSGYTYAAWNWKAGNGTSSNTDGSITSTVSVNQKAGFSIVSYTGTAASATVGHGLGAKPAMLIVKKRTDAAPGGARGWSVWHQSLATDKVLELNTTNAQLTEANFFIEGNINSTTFGVGADYNTGWTDDYIAYCFAEVEGYSKFGSYTGNGSTDGPFVYTGFRPAWVMVKRTDSTGEWWMYDEQREPFNVMDTFLIANGSSAEIGPDAASYGLDFVSNGFKWRSGLAASNGSGGTFIYMAFAEMPAKYSLGR